MKDPERFFCDSITRNVKSITRSVMSVCRGGSCGLAGDHAVDVFPYLCVCLTGKPCTKAAVLARVVPLSNWQGVMPTPTWQRSTGNIGYPMSHHRDNPGSVFGSCHPDPATHDKHFSTKGHTSGGYGRSF